MPFVLLMGAGASPISWQTQVTPCRGVLDAGGTFGSPAGSKSGAAFPEAVWGSPQDPFLSCFTWEWLSSTLQAQPCSQPPCQQLLPTLGCFPPLLLFGSRELFWSWGVNTEAGPTAGRSDTGQVVSSVRAEISGGSRVLLPPENMSLGSRCSARGRGSMGGLPRRRAHALFLGETSSKPSKVSTTHWGSPHFGEPIQSHPRALHQIAPALQKRSYKNNVLL